MAPLDRPTILIIDPDTRSAARLRDLLSLRYGVEVVPSAATAHAYLAAAPRPPALVVLELELPDVDGLILCADLRARTPAALLVHTSRDSQRDLVLSLRLGADDFVPKPGDPTELEARIGALVRRMARSALSGGGARSRPQGAERSGEDGAVQRVGDLVIDRERATAMAGDRRLHLTQTEFRLLSAFARHLDQPLTRADLAQVAGDDAYVAGTRALDMHVRRLRAKLSAAREEAAAAAGELRVPVIVPVRGTGYRMTTPERPLERPTARRIAPPAA